MAYGFNDDKSKFDLDAMFVRFGGSANVAAKGAQQVVISQSRVSSAGIDNLANYAVVSAMYSTDGGATWHSDMETPIGNPTAFPSAIVTNFTSGGAIRIQLVNNTTVSATMTYRIVLMRLPSTSN